MSHSLYFVRLPAGTDPDDEATIGALVDRLAQTEDAGPRDAAAEARKDALAAALMAADPTLERCEYDYPAIAEAEGIDEATARGRFRSLDLQGPPDGHRITVTLHDVWASTDMPWGRAPNGVDEMAALRVIARVLVHEGGYVCYDPQGPNMVDVDDDAAWGESRPPEPEPAERPWWRFW